MIVVVIAILKMLKKHVQHVFYLKNNKKSLMW